MSENNLIVETPHCGPGRHTTVSLNDPKLRHGYVCTLCGEIFEYVFILHLGNMTKSQQPRTKSTQ